MRDVDQGRIKATSAIGKLKFLEDSGKKVQVILSFYTKILCTWTVYLCCILLCSTWTLLKNYLDITALHFPIASAVFDMMVMLYLSWRQTPLNLLLVRLWGSQRYIFLYTYCIFKRFLIRFVFNKLLFEMNQKKESSIFSLMKVKIRSSFNQFWVVKVLVWLPNPGFESWTESSNY